MDTVRIAAMRLYPREFSIRELSESIDWGERPPMETTRLAEVGDKLCRLRRYGIVSRREEGRAVYYRYEPDGEVE